MKDLRLRFLGGWQAWHDQNELPLKGVKTRALLAYLAVEARQAHLRDTLLGLLWPDMPQDRARNNLRVTLANLRRGLAQENDEPKRLLANRSSVQFNRSERFWLDVAAFYAHLDAVEDHAHGALSDCQSCRLAMTQAVGLYQGEFLAGFHVPGCPAFDEWLLVQRERLHIQAIELLDRLAQIHEEAQELRMAMGYTRRQIELDPLQEEAHRRLMRLLASQGKRSAALAAYRYCQGILLQELGVEPDARTIMLAQQIRNGSYPPPRISRSRAGMSPHREPRHNLPENLTPFIGREGELAQLDRRLQEGDYRLIAIVGPGGIGKTRLAVEVARRNRHRFVQGVYFVSLASRERVDEVPTAIADAMGLTFEEGKASPIQQILEALRERHLLLILDNLEQLLGPIHPSHARADDHGLIPFLLQILHQAPEATLLVTSRERLDVRAEDLFLLRGLPGPTAGELAQARTYPAVRLFCEQAYRRHKAFRLTEENVGHVVRICRLVDGTPLGIELATTWIHELGPARLADALAADLALLATTERDVPPQHRSMEAAFAYSWRLLSGPEQRVLARLTVFRGGFCRDAAQQVAGATTLLLTQLRFKSLLRSIGPDRYDTHPLVAQFAAHRLVEVGGAEESRTRHSRFYLAFLAEETPALAGAQAQQAVTRLGQELDNIQKGWRTAFQQGQLAGLEASLPGLARFYRLRGLLAEGESLLAEGMEQAKALAAQDPEGEGWDRLHLRLFTERTNMLIRLAQLDEAVQNARAVIARARELGDPVTETRGHILIGYSRAQRGEGAGARRALERAVILARHESQTEMEGAALRYLGNVLMDVGERKEGERRLEEALVIQRRVGNRSEEQAVLLYLGVCKIEEGDYVAGQGYLAQALRLIQTTGNRPLEARIVNALGFVAAALGDFPAAMAHHRRSQRLSQEIGDPFQESHALHNLCTVTRKMGQLSQAEAHGRQALALAQEYQLPDPESYAWLHLGYVWLEQGALNLASQAFRRSLEGWLALDRTTLAMEAQAGLAAVFLEQGEKAQALQAVTSVLATLEAHGLVGVDEPLAITLTCYRVLKACKDKRHRAVLNQAYQHLRARAAHILDIEQHTRFVQGIPAHRQVMAFHLAEQAAVQEP